MLLALLLIALLCFAAPAEAASPTARASVFVPNDPGRAGTPGGWTQLQWNLAGPTSVNASGAWEHLIASGRHGGNGVIVAVLDTGVAYADRGRYRRTPDISPKRFVRGYDFVDDDPYPNDVNGHGTHVASTIAETANNAIGVVGLAYGARIMPVRVLNREGVGRVSRIAAGIRWAVDHGADVINLSVEFDAATTVEYIPEVVQAIRYARRKSVLVVSASGNSGSPFVAYPARVAQVLAVGATTEHGCQAAYGNTGTGLDLVAPGGGHDANRPGDPACRPQEAPGRPIYQMTFLKSVREFGLPGGYEGTSMAAAHVSATAALVIASGVLGPAPTPAAIERRLRRTARDLGAPGWDRAYGWGLIDAAAATDPALP
jgi:serine protease